MSTGRRWPAIFVFILALVCVPSLAQNASTRVLHLTWVDGDVQVNPNTGVGWEQAINNMPVTAGSRIWAAHNSVAVVRLEDGSTIRLVGPAEIVLTQLSFAVNGAVVDLIEVDGGKVFFNADLPGLADFRIQDPDGKQFLLTEPSVLSIDVGKQTALLAVQNGEVRALDLPGQPAFRGGETYYYALERPE